MMVFSGFIVKCFCDRELKKPAFLKIVYGVSSSIKRQLLTGVESMGTENEASAFTMINVL
jgi:hypothetical protein